jgi:two-component system, cell cycle sensor histidine kinase and response regulator CckA
MRILLIDDDEAVLEVIALMLTAQGHAVVTAVGGRDGLARLAAGGPVDLVLTDLAMPGMSGWDVVRAVRAGWPAVPVGLVTGTPDHLPAEAEAVDVLIAKPVTLESLRLAMSTVEARRRVDRG